MPDERDADQEPEPGQDDANRPRQRSVAEWTTLAVSAVIIAALIGVALFEHFAASEPAGAWLEVRLAPERTERRGDLFYVPFTIANRGAAPAEGVTLVFEVRQGEEVLEESTADIQFLANSGSAAGEVVTQHDPATHEITGRVGTLQTP